MSQQPLLPRSLEDQEEINLRGSDHRSEHECCEAEASSTPTRRAASDTANQWVKARGSVVTQTISSTTSRD